MIERTFEKVSKNDLIEAEQNSLLLELGWSNNQTWEDLLKSKRILIISEAGTGKTYECQKQAKKLWNDGQPAFFVELSALATSNLTNLLTLEEEERLSNWLTSQSEIATFFLDSVDELKLSQGSFKSALVQLQKSIKNQLNRVRIVVTTRPIPFDRELVECMFPIPPAPVSESKEETFAKVAMGEGTTNSEENTKNGWCSVKLMPFSDQQILEFATTQQIESPSELLDELRKRNAQEFARRPQDLIELCADWRDHKCIRSHQEQIKSNIAIKLLPRSDREEPAELSPDRAIEGSSKLALAMLLTKRLTIRHNAESDDIHKSNAIDPSTVLPDWTPKEKTCLLERALFGFASYGRVRFHHRSVIEFLAAKRLHKLLQVSMSFRALKRILFTERKGSIIVRPSMRPVAAWLAIKVTKIFELLRDNEPVVLLEHGDPESLSENQRAQALKAYVNRYGPGGWRGIDIPRIQVHRFAVNSLAGEINKLWNLGIENYEVRETLLEIIETARINECADIAYEALNNSQNTDLERVVALHALVAVNDSRLTSLAESFTTNSSWPKEITRCAIISMFPAYFSIEQLCIVLATLKENKRTIGGLSWQLPRLIDNLYIENSQLELLRDGLVELIEEDLAWSKKKYAITSSRIHLTESLAAACVKGIPINKSTQWLHAAALTLSLKDRDYATDEMRKSLKEMVSGLIGADRAKYFWAKDSLFQSLKLEDDPWKRLTNIIFQSNPIELSHIKDFDWLIECLNDNNVHINAKKMLLEAAMRLGPENKNYQEHLKDIKSKILSNDELVTIVDKCLKLAKYNPKKQPWEKRQEKVKAQQERRKAKDRASWFIFWREVANNPDKAFSLENEENTVWNLWHAMANEGENSRESGWNRRFIENQFGKDVADRLRVTLMRLWRNERPTLGSERPKGERNTYYNSWLLGLAAIYAEAEDPLWATKLSPNEAALAARYAPLNMNGLPFWIENLITAHNDAVISTIGSELIWELEDSETTSISMLLLALSNSSDSIIIKFLPSLTNWLQNTHKEWATQEPLTNTTQDLQSIIEIILKYGSEHDRQSLLAIAENNYQKSNNMAFNLIWLKIIILLAPEQGIKILEDKANSITPAADSEMVVIFARYFGDRGDAISLENQSFHPQLLLRLVKLAYQHIRPIDDVKHDGVYTPDIRDHAQRARNNILSAIFKTKGEDGWTVKTEMVSDPLFSHFKDRIQAIAEEAWAQELDNSEYSVLEVETIEKFGEAPAKTNEAMFSIMRDRLLDIDDLLLSDLSPKEAWAKIDKENVMRRQIARELSHLAKGLYTVDQEAVTAEEKETDIRLRSTISNHEAIIELKLADNRTATDLKDTIYNQLVKKYMAPENSRSGCLLITLAKDRKWEHPLTKNRIDLDELRTLLKEEAKRVMSEMAGTVSLLVHIIDLRPRLPKE